MWGKDRMREFQYVRDEEMFRNKIYAWYLDETACTTVLNLRGSLFVHRKMEIIDCIVRYTKKGIY